MTLLAKVYTTKVGGCGVIYLLVKFHNFWTYGFGNIKLFMLAVLISGQTRSSVFNYRFNHLKVKIKIWSLHESFRSLSVDSNNVFFCYHIFCRLKDMKKWNSKAAIVVWSFRCLGWMVVWMVVWQGDIEVLYLLECLLVWVVIWPCFVKQVVVPRIAPIAVISSLEASKHSGGCYLL